MEGIEVPLLSGIMQTGYKPKIVLAQDIDYPPYAYLETPATPDDDYALAGLVVDITNGMSEICAFDVIHVQTDWEQCWDAGKIGTDLKNGVFHGCMSYTHTKGVRNRYLDFTNAVTSKGAAGFLVRLDSSGKPEVDPMSNLFDVRVVDITGWAPTVDGMMYVSNDCTGEAFEVQDYRTLHTGDNNPYTWTGIRNG